MRLKAVVFVPLAAAGLIGLAVIGEQKEPAGMQMTGAAEKFVGMLNDEQKAKAQFGFDDKERTNWNFVPLQDKEKKSTRKGLPLQQMTAEQKDAAIALRQGRHQRGGLQEGHDDHEPGVDPPRAGEAKGTMVRNPEWYFFTVFGTPSKTGKWGWRVEGHHLSLNFTIDRGKVLAATPAFFGANPAEVKAGDAQGAAHPAGSGRLCARSCSIPSTPTRRKVAFQAKQFPEIEQHVTKPGVGGPVGLVAEKMTKKQQGDALESDRQLRRPYAAGGAPAQLDEVTAAGLDKVHFAFGRDDDKPGKPYTYRVQGPTFVIEFLNIQADSAKQPRQPHPQRWRNLGGDFGLAGK